MTIYDLTQAIARYKRFLMIGFASLLVFVAVLTFTLEDGEIAWRGGAKYQSGFQISVVAPGSVSLSERGEGGNLAGTAARYSDLLGTGEAALGIGEMSGYVLRETLNSGVARDSSIITGTVIGPSPDLAMAASQNAFLWLAQKIQQPLNSLPPIATTVPPIPSVNLEGTFPSSLSVEVDESLSSVSPDLFVLVDAGQIQSVAVPVAQRAGGAVAAGVTLEAGGSLLLSLERSDGTLHDVLRLAPGPLPATAPAYPSLTIRLGPGALEEVNVEVDEAEADVLIWAFNPAAITLEWVEGILEVQPVDVETQQVQIAMLTGVPTAEQIGGRRAPLMGFSVLLVGVILLLTSVIVADTWRRDRDAREVSTVAVSYELSGGPDRSVHEKTGAEVEHSVLGAGAPDVAEPTLREQ